MDISYTTEKRPNLDTFKQFLYRHGENQWNFLPEDGINAEFEQVGLGNGHIISAEQNQVLAGFCLSLHGEACPSEMFQFGNTLEMLYVAEVVVAETFSGKGIASRLLEESIELAKELNLVSVYLQRHEENLGSAGMMRKAGFEHVKTFFDPDKRSSGSRNTTVMRYAIRET